MSNVLLVNRINYLASQRDALDIPMRDLRRTISKIENGLIPGNVDGYKAELLELDRQWHDLNNQRRAAQDELFKLEAATRLPVETMPAGKTVTCETCGNRWDECTCEAPRPTNDDIIAAVNAISRPVKLTPPQMVIERQVCSNALTDVLLSNDELIAIQNRKVAALVAQRKRIDDELFATQQKLATLRGDSVGVAAPNAASKVEAAIATWQNDPTPMNEAATLLAVMNLTINDDAERVAALQDVVDILNEHIGMMKLANN